MVIDMVPSDYMNNPFQAAEGKRQALCMVPRLLYLTSMFM